MKTNMTDLPMLFAFAVIHSDGWRGYDGLLDVGYAKHLSAAIILASSDPRER